MTWSIRRAVCTLTAVVALTSAALLHTAFALEPVRKLPPVPPQTDIPVLPDQPKGSTEFSDSIQLPKNNVLKDKLIAAGDYIKLQDWVEATKILQLLVEQDSDVFAQVPTKGPDGKETFVWASVKTEANRMLNRLPDDGKRYYQRNYGPTALGILNDAKKTGDPRLLGELMKRYLHTDAGAEATNLLATYYLDRGDFTIAAICFERLLNREGSNNVAPLTLFKAAYAFHQIGDKANETRAWRELNTRTRELKIGNDMKPIAELQEYVNAVAKGAPVQNLATWQMFGGNLQRNGRGEGDTAYMERAWAMQTVEGQQSLRDRLKVATDQLDASGQAILPGFHPITAIVTRPADGKQIPIVVYRSHWGLHAYDMANKKVAWKTPMDSSLERLMSSTNTVSAVNSWVDWFANAKRPNILFENSTIGTLSSDGALVFAVDDVAVPPPPPLQQGMDFEGPKGYNPNPNYDDKLKDAVHHSRLRAYSLSSGKLVWQQGSKDDPKEDKELRDSYFLGPPLPMAGKLYVLTEKNQELRLICLEAATGKLLQVQQLATTRDKMLIDVARRVQAAHLCYGEGMLVCPTNAGAILGIDLLTNSLVWAFSYREKSDAKDDPPVPIDPGFRRPPRGIPPQPQYNPNKYNHWKVSAPIIQDGKVVFAAPDGQRVYCLNLRDGSRIWDQHRQEDDLYLGGVYNGKVIVVNKKSVRALSLAKGEQIWSVETGVPSGQGVASGDIYYLPLKQSTKTKEPEICAIDIEKGIIHAHTRSRHKEVPGNLVFFEGAVISQTEKEIVAFPQLRAKLAEIDAKINKEPNSPVVLTERGDLRLDRGDLQGAVEDLSAALKNDPPADLKAKARAKLFDTLTEFLQRDFNAAEKYVKDYEELCTVDLTGATTDQEREQRLAETRRRRANYLFLVAKGKESQRKLVEAFEKYQEFGAIAGGTTELFTVSDEPTVKASPDVWAQGRIAAMVAEATPAERAPLEALIATKWANVQKSNDLEELRKFVSVFGNLFTVGKEARLKLAEKLMDGTDPMNLLDAERHLTILRGRNESPDMAGRAVEALARLNFKRGLIEDAAYYYELLNREYGKVMIRDGKTGADIYNDLATNKFLLPLLDRAGRLGVSGRMKADEERGNYQPAYQTYFFELAGEALPFFQQNQVALRHDHMHQFKLIERATGQEKMTQRLTPTQFANIITQTHQTRFSYMTLGHLVVLPVGHMVFGIDPVNQKVLWERNLHSPIPALGGRPDSSGMPAISQPLVVDPKDGSVVAVYAEGWRQRLGQTSPLEGSTICLQAREGLMAVDPLTGRVLWVRTDIGSRSKIFGDGETVYVVEMDENNNPSTTRALRASDGVKVAVPDFTTLYSKPTTRLFGRTLLVQETLPTGGVNVRHYDVRTGQDLWSETFPAGCTVTKSEDPNLVPVLNPGDGKLRVFDLRTKKEVLSATMNPADLAGSNLVTVLADGTYFIVAIHGPTDPQSGGVQSGILPNTGIQSVPVNGMLYCFDGATGKRKWYNRCDNQMVVVDYFQDMPIVLMTSRYNKRSSGPAGPFMNIVAVRSIEKSTGKIKYDNDSDPNPTERRTFPSLPQGMNFHGLVVDSRSGKVELVGSAVKVIHTLEPVGTK
jgi:outer membrane protein assembly factor BamB/tetratricopeptide (TPR) repeat protein